MSARRSKRASATAAIRTRATEHDRGPGNPPDSPWYSTPAADRTRKPVTLTLSPKGRAALEAHAKRKGLSLSAAVEELLGVAS